MDAITAFPNSKINHEIYVEPMVGFDVPDFPRKDFVSLFLNALYGLKQSPLLWLKTVNTAMIEMGFKVLVNRPCLYIQHGDDRSKAPDDLADIIDWDQVVIVLVYVDDFAVATKHDSRMWSVKAQLATRFTMTDNGPLTHHLGLVIKLYGPNADGVTHWAITNPNYITALLEEHGMLSCTPCSTPITPGWYPEDSPDDLRFAQPKVY